MRSRSPYLIRILEWDNSHRTSIEISLSIILHLHFIWLESSFFEKSHLHTFLRFAYLSIWFLAIEIHLFMLSIPKVAGNHVWYKRPPFDNKYKDIL